MKEATNAIGLDFYNIMMIEERAGDYKNFTFFENTKMDQDTATEMIEALAKSLLEGGMAMDSDPKLIDVTKYSEVPADYAAGKAINSANATAANGVGTFAAPANRYTGTAGTYTKQTVVKPDPSPTVLERTKTKKPTKAIIDEMNEKVKSICDGTFVPDLPEIMGVDEDGVEEVVPANQYGNFYM